MCYIYFYFKKYSRYFAHSLFLYDLFEMVLRNDFDLNMNV